MKEAILIIIGALISCGTTWFLDLIKFNREEKIYYKRKKEDVLLASINYVQNFVAKINIYKQNKYLPNTEREKYNMLLVQIKMYAGKKLQEKFYKMLGEIMYDINNSGDTFKNEDIDNYINLVRKELKIED